MSLLDKMKNKIKGKSIDEEIDVVFRDESSYSKRVLDANQRPQANNTPPVQEARNNPFAQNTAPTPPMQNTGSAYEPARTSPLLKARQGVQQNAPQELPDEDEFMRQRFGADQIADKDVPPPPDLIGLPGTDVEKLTPPRQTFAHGQNIGSSEVLDELLLSMKDLRAQNNHIIDLLRNMQDRLSKH
ncbi:MAG: hypothetical protein KAJ91_00230 [Candidatus Aenigmarchaeota archaeon]|nr:hypothetical protein [Candidatus Aenigmarchaeota archaeon]